MCYGLNSMRYCKGYSIVQLEICGIRTDVEMDSAMAYSLMLNRAKVAWRYEYTVYYQAYSTSSAKFSRFKVDEERQTRLLMTLQSGHIRFRGGSNALI